MPEHAATHRAIEGVWRIESARLVAGLVRTTRDVGLAEELAQEAFVAALQQWPESGVPENPGAWLMTTARRRAIDRLRRDRRLKGVQDDLARELEHRGAPGVSPERESMLDGGVEDDVLRLIFMACHPVLSSESRAAITLRLVCGLTTDEVARAFVTPEPTMAQRIVRAKRTLAEKNVSFDVPTGADLPPRLSSVLEVIYLLFNEGYAATAGEAWTRPDLCGEALRLGRMLAAMMPREPEVHGLAALMELQASRLGARTDAAGRPVLLMDQNRARWDQLLIRRGLAALESAQRLGEHPGPYTLQAAIAACHSRARTGPETDWPRIATLYDELLRVAPSPVVALNRAVAVGMARGLDAGLALLDSLATDPLLAEYHLLPSIRGEFLRRLGRLGEAKRELERAASLTRNSRERDLLLERARACDHPPESS